jgi:hypothetical protein
MCKARHQRYPIAWPRPRLNALYRDPELESVPPRNKFFLFLLKIRKHIETRKSSSQIKARGMTVPSREQPSSGRLIRFNPLS